MLAEVTEVFLSDRNSDNFYKIGVSLKQGFGGATNAVAYPLNPYIKSIPLIGEQVYLITATGPESGPLSGGYQYYYISPTFLQRGLNNNPLPGAVKNTITSLNVTTNYSSPNPQRTNTTNRRKDFGKGFVEIKGLSQLQPYIGDVIFEGRFGQSIRFGYTPQRPETINRPTWTSTQPGSPITIIRNGAAENKGYDKFIVEDINEDSSCIWLTDGQRVKLKLANKVGIIRPDKLVGNYNSSQVIINSNRLVFNSKSDSIVLSSNDNIYVSTTKWKADINTMFSQIEELKNTLQSLTTTLQTMVIAYSALTAPPLTPIGAPALVANTQITSQVIPALARITTELTKMKQL